MKTNKWDSINVELLLSNDSNEITRAYQTLKPYFMWYMSDNEELVNDVFMRVLQKLTCYNKAKPFHSWVYKILENCKKDNYNKTKKSKSFNPADYYTGDDLENVLYKYDFGVYQKEQIDLLEQSYFNDRKENRYELLNKLPEMELKFICDYAKDSIEKTPNNRKRYQRLCKKLQKLDR